MKGKDFIPLLGRTADDPLVKEALEKFGIAKTPRLERGRTVAYAVNEKKGIDFTFEDERMLDLPLREYEEGALVLVNIRFYAEGVEGYRQYRGELPYGLKFEMGWKEALALIGKKPAKEDSDLAIERWDFKGHCLFLEFNEKGTKIRTVALQTPVK